MFKVKENVGLRNLSHLLMERITYMHVLRILYVFTFRTDTSCHKYQY